MTILYLFFPDSQLTKECLKFSLCCCSIWDTFLSIENYGKTKESKDNIQSDIHILFFIPCQKLFWTGPKLYGYVWNTLHSYYKIHKCFYIPLVSRRLKKQGNGPLPFSPLLHVHYCNCHDMQADTGPSSRRKKEINRGPIFSF